MAGAYCEDYGEFEVKGEKAVVEQSLASKMSAVPKVKFPMA